MYELNGKECETECMLHAQKIFCSQFNNFLIMQALGYLLLTTRKQKSFFFQKLKLKRFIIKKNHLQAHM